MRKILLPVAAHALISKTKAFTSRCRACADKPRLHSLESRALTHLESIGLGNAAFISMGGPQAHGNSQRGQAESQVFPLACQLSRSHSASRCNHLLGGETGTRHLFSASFLRVGA